jgi:hypothetical protein
LLQLFSYFSLFLLSFASCFNGVSETTYGIAYVKLSDLKADILTEIKPFSPDTSSSSSKMKAINDEMEDFYREYHDSLQPSSYCASSTGSNIPKRKSSSHSSSSLSGNRGLKGWFTTYSDLDEAKGARENAVKSLVDPSYYRSLQQLTVNDAGKQASTAHHNISEKIINPFFKEEPITANDQQSKNINSQKKGSVISQPDSSNSIIPIQVQLRIRVIEFIPR